VTGTGTQARSHPVLDDVANAAFRRRLDDLDAEIEGAEPDHDDYRADRARKVMAAWIRDAVRRVGEVHPELGAHLAESVHTGTWCAYRPA